MKTRSHVKPDPVTLEVIDKSMTDVILTTNVTESPENDLTLYTYDSYRITQKNRLVLKESIEKNFDTWLEFAKQKEIECLAEPILKRRKELLDETDIVYCNAQLWETYSDEVKTEWSIYKQALRDVPLQPEYPYVVDWPTRPV